MRVSRMKFSILLVSAILLVSFVIGYNLYSASTNGTGYVTVSTPPTVSNINLYDSNDGTNLVTTTTTITPYDPMTLTFDVSDSDGLNTLSTIKVVLYHNSTTATSPDDVQKHATFTWNASTGTWTVSPSSTTWAVNNTASQVPTTGTTGTVTLVFTPGKVALYSNVGEWVIYVEVTDQQGQTGSASATNYNVAAYSEITLSQTTFNFGLVGPGVVNASLTDPATGYITITIIANGPFGLQFTATDWTDASSNPVVDLDTFNSLLADDDGNLGETTETGQKAFFVRNTAAAPQWTGYAATTEAGITINLYLWVTLPSNIGPGTYSLTLTILVVI